MSKYKTRVKTVVFCVMCGPWVVEPEYLDSFITHHEKLEGGKHKVSRDG